ncbi:MAG: cyclic nucleotide-binding domain-containing protein [Candidatus Coatesbacteria bacterium]|nr:cyclic nucleotide-binding domain-containing protein [Candidatus Coatesbacteria bacterium]
MKPTSSEMIVFIKHLPIFQYLDDDELSVFSGFLTWITVEEGQFLFREGQKSTGLFFLQNGRLQVIKGIDTDEPETISFLNRGAIVGEMAMINGHTRSASVVAIWKADLLFLSNDAFKMLEEENPKLTVKILKSLIRILSERVRNNYHGH